MKRIIAILLMLVLIFALASCGKDKDKDKNDDNTNTSTSTETNVESDTETDTSTDTSTDTETDTSTDTTAPIDGVEVILTASKSEIAVGGKVTITVTVVGAPKVKSAGIMVKYDADIFTMVSGEALKSGEVESFDGDTGVIAFATPTDVNTAVFEFTLKAKEVAEEESVSCKLSLIGADDNPIEISKVTPAIVTVK